MGDGVRFAAEAEAAGKRADVTGVAAPGQVGAGMWVEDGPGAEIRQKMTLGFRKFITS